MGNSADEAELYDCLDGQVALVTGANRGLGAEIASELVELGATVYAGTRDIENVTAEELRPVQLDVTSNPEIEEAFRTVEQEAGQLDILVNNAGIHGPSGALADLSPTEINQTLLTNLHGSTMVSHYALPLLEKQDGGRIVNISSGDGWFGDGISSSHLPYGVSKAGVNALTSALADQYPDLLINAVYPGWIQTDMGGEDAPRTVAKGAETAVWLARFKPGGQNGYVWYDKEIFGWA